MKPYEIRKLEEWPDVNDLIWEGRKTGQYGRQVVERKGRKKKIRRHLKRSDKAKALRAINKELNQS